MKNDQGNTNVISRSPAWDKLFEIEGTPEREKYELELEALQIGELIQEARKRQNLTQAQLAIRAGTSKNLISRIENGETDIRLSTFMKIINVGLGGQIKLSIEV